MYFSLDPSLNSLTDAELKDYEFEFDVLLGAHYRQGILLSLMPAEALRIEHLALGPVARAALGAIRRRSADYAEAAARARRRFQLCSDGKLGTAFQIAAGGIVLVDLREFAKGRGQKLPQLFLEHAVNDRRALEMIFDAYCAFAKLPGSLIVTRPCHGGGASLGDVLRAQPPGSLVGLCVCDRDCAPYQPERPYKAGGTADHAHAAAVELNLVGHHEFGRNSTNPYFALLLTHPRTVEGYVGPHLLDEYLATSPELRAVRTRFINAFPSFPNISEDEMRLWFCLNLKDAKLRADEIPAALLEVGVDVAHIGIDIEAAMALTLPNDTVAWLSTNLQTGRYKTQLQRAFAKDLEFDCYRNAVEDLVALMWDQLAADRRMATA